MSKIVILSFSEGEEEVCQRILQILSESTRFEGCSELQVEKNIGIGEMKLNLAEKNVVIHGAEVMLTNRRPYGALVIGSTKITQNEAARRLAASFCIVPDDIQDMSCSYTGDNPRNVQDKVNGR